ncbi:hypothetical protein W97_07379 [Coniosporium apollinis CBS 100218]|uniref:Dienelactone hydrolase domain-containing protein n=1 Tax=Coniosporium apollinis (strain CBS 100218) TaxID=1168221 RepID=R7Z144_CONA1|nr:uncharacterized protein W97_07379 [Coniosporium apollinis CBS 100218]EON67882.1 hypothetical protein W97_07379 [Coniosporium apollinis CBS 100218]
MTSHPPAQCCTIGVKHEGEAVGEIKNVGDTPTYFSYPKDKSTHNAVLILTDVIGHEFINVQLIADQFAANGYLVVMPDLFHGDPLPLNRPADHDFMGWLNKHPTSRVEPVIEATLKHMRGELGCKAIGGVGYCFGGKYVARWLKKGKLDAGYTAHPSFMEADELRGIEGPLSIAAAETDSIFPAEKRHETEEILHKMSVPYQINLFSGVEHGFAVRAEIDNKEKRFAKEQAFYQAVQWFDAYVKA